jgi:hypothetical protein
MIRAVGRAIEYYLPKGCHTHARLPAQFPWWSVEKIQEKRANDRRHVAGLGECPSIVPEMQCAK